MNILFFQNCVSPHQMPYIKELGNIAGVQDVVVISPVDDLEERKNMGWGSNVRGEEKCSKDVTVIIAPNKEDVEALFHKYEGQETWCMFSGINAFPEVASWFRISLGYNVKRGIITEPPYIYEHPLWQHAVRFALKDWKYTKYIDKFFVMGDEYIGYYRMWSKRWDVIPFMYCTEWKERTMPVPASERLKVLYVGSLSHRKNVSELLNAVKSLPSECQNDIEIGLVGDGDKRQELETIVNSDGYKVNTVFYGNKQMEDIPQIMQQYDVLVLPSLHDGWGAVVNEALTLGLYVICSNHCGAKYLLKDRKLGSCYQSGDEQALMILLQQCQDCISSTRTDVQYRVKWAFENITGKAVAAYFVKFLQ